MKLSKAQNELLIGIAYSGPLYVADYYPPAKKLVEYGLAEWSGYTLKITDLGVKTVKPPKKWKP